MADNTQILNCPACKKEMSKIFIDDAGINVDICLDGCGGILFDNRELEKFNNKNTEQILNLVENKNFENVDKTKPRICPICNIPMVSMGSGNSNIKIDVCNICGAKFLDNGELQTIINASGQNQNNEKLAKNIINEIMNR